MKTQTFRRKISIAVGPVALAACLIYSANPALAAAQVATAQTTDAPAAPPSNILSDAQIEANVVRALAGSPKLAGANITTTAVFGKVTLSGVVADEASRQLAETLASQASGVKGVLDNITVGNPSAASDNGPDPAAGNMAPAPQDAQQGQPQSQPQNGPSGSNAPGNYPQRRGRRAPYPQGGQQNYPTASENASSSLRPQVAGERVVVQGGAALQVRIMQELDSKHIAAGAPFQGTVLNDVIADNTVAIPRGAVVSGVVVEAKHPGFWSGTGTLVLQANSVQVNGQTVPLITYMYAAPNQRAYLPAEAIVRFRLQRSATVVTVSQQDLARLAASVPLLRGVPPENNPRYRQRYGTSNPDPGYTDDDQN